MRDRRGNRYPEIQLYLLELEALKGLTAAEIEQIQNINLVAISNTQWAYLGELNQSLIKAANAIFASITLNNTGLHLLDTDASHDLIIKPGSDLTADRTYTITTGDSDRTITLSGNPTLNDWFDQNVKTTATPTFVQALLSGLTASRLMASNGTKGDS